MRKPVNDLNIGDTIFHVFEKVNSFSRKKIEFVDSTGVTWYRYDKPLREYLIRELVIVGKTYIVCEGETNNLDNDNRWYYRVVGEDRELDLYDFFSEDDYLSRALFSSREEAELEVANCKKEYETE
jgi:hypothetical protein